MKPQHYRSTALFFFLLYYRNPINHNFFFDVRYISVEGVEGRWSKKNTESLIGEIEPRASAHRTKVVLTVSNFLSLPLNTT